MKCFTTIAQAYKTFRTVYLPSFVAGKPRSFCNSVCWMQETGIATVPQDYIKRRNLDNKAAQTETQEHCSIRQTGSINTVFLQSYVRHLRQSLTII